MDENTVKDMATTVYTYDDANRLVNVGGVAYTWDNNIGTGSESKTPASDDRGFLFQTGGVNYALAAGDAPAVGAVWRTLRLLQHAKMLDD